MKIFLFYLIFLFYVLTFVCVVLLSPFILSLNTQMYTDLLINKYIIGIVILFYNKRIWNKLFRINYLIQIIWNKLFEITYLK